MPRKLSHCDGCGKDRPVHSCGRDSNGDPDAPDLCFLCRKEGDRGRVFDRKLGRYRSYYEIMGEQYDALAERDGAFYEDIEP